MRKLNKILAMLAVVTMLVSMVSIAAVAEDVYREPHYDHRVYDELANTQSTGWFAKILKDKFNVEMNIISTNLDPNAWQTRMAAGELGDLVIIGDMGDHLITAINANLLTGLERAGSCAVRQHQQLYTGLPLRKSFPTSS